MLDGDQACDEGQRGCVCRDPLLVLSCAETHPAIGARLGLHRGVGLGKSVEGGLDDSRPILTLYVAVCQHQASSWSLSNARARVEDSVRKRGRKVVVVVAVLVFRVLDIVLGIDVAVAVTDFRTSNIASVKK